MDEPTSALTAREIDDLFRVIRELKAKGCDIVYISHRLEELWKPVCRRWKALLWAARSPIPACLCLQSKPFL